MFCRTMIPTRHEINILPAQADQLAEAKPGAEAHEKHRAPLTIGRLDQSLGFLVREEVELRLRRTQPLDLRNRGAHRACARSKASDAGPSGRC
jgi:hypothetical protein